jgi:serine/threonine protein kinase
MEASVIDGIKKEGKWEGRSVPLYSVKIEDDRTKVADYDFVAKGEGGEAVGIKVLGEPKYQLVTDNPLTWGGSSTISLAYEPGLTLDHPDEPRLFAVKQVNGDADRDGFLTTIEEARELSQYSSPFVAKVYDIVADEANNVYMVMEFLEGGELFEKDSEKYQILPQDAHKFAFQMCSAVAYVHRNIRLHNDIKTRNFVFTKEPNSSPYTEEDPEDPTPAEFKTTLNKDIDIKLIDFGIRTYIDSDVTKPAPSTPGYSAKDEKSDWGPRSDVYSLSLTLGKLIFEDFEVYGTDLAEEVDKATFNKDYTEPEIQRRIKEIIKKGIGSPKDRYQSVYALYKDLNQVFVDMGCPNLYPKLLD